VGNNIPAKAIGLVAIKAIRNADSWVTDHSAAPRPRIPKASADGGGMTRLYLCNQKFKTKVCGLEEDEWQLSTMRVD
jgi:hypothetical protein